MLRRKQALSRISKLKTAMLHIEQSLREALPTEIVSIYDAIPRGLVGNLRLGCSRHNCFYPGRASLRTHSGSGAESVRWPRALENRDVPGRPPLFLSGTSHR